MCRHKKNSLFIKMRASCLVVPNVSGRVWGLSLRLNRNDATVALATLEHNHTVGEGEERVVAAHTYVFAGIVNCTALANDDVAGDASLATPDLNTQTL